VRKPDSDLVDLSGPLITYLSYKSSSDRQGTVGDLLRKCGQTSGRRPEHDLRAFPGVEFGVVTKALAPSEEASVPFALETAFVFSSSPRTWKSAMYNFSARPCQKEAANELLPLSLATSLD